MRIFPGLYNFSIKVVLVEGAGELFAQISSRDPIAAAYLEKCRLYQDDPPQEWQVCGKLPKKAEKQAFYI